MRFSVAAVVIAVAAWPCVTALDNVGAVGGFVLNLRDWALEEFLYLAIFWGALSLFFRDPSPAGSLRIDPPRARFSLTSLFLLTAAVALILVLRSDVLIAGSIGLALYHLPRVLTRPIEAPAHSLQIPMATFSGLASFATAEAWQSLFSDKGSLSMVDVVGGIHPLCDPGRAPILIAAGALAGFLHFWVRWNDDGPESSVTEFLKVGGIVSAQQLLVTSIGAGLYLLHKPMRGLLRASGFSIILGVPLALWILAAYLIAKKDETGAPGS